MNKELLFSLTKKDFRVDTFKSGGKGGQHQNKTNSGVRITHLETGISSESRKHREQLQNKKAAFNKLCNKQDFKLWLNAKTNQALTGREDINKWVEAQMQEQNLKVEYYDPNI